MRLALSLSLAASRRSAPPVVLSISPAFGSTAGDTVPHVLAGTGFAGVAASGAVTIGGAACTYTKDSDTQITITATPARTAGLHDVAVGAGTLAGGYRAVAIAAWYRADLGRTMNGGTVSAWADQSGNADANRNAVQGTAASQPTYTASDANFNNRAALSFDSGDNLRSGVWSASLAQPCTFYVVGRTTTANVAVALDSLTLAELVIYSNTNNVAMFAGAALSSGIAWQNTLHVVCGAFNGATSNLYVDRYGTASATGNAGAFSPLTGVTIGMAFNIAAPFVGSISSIIMASGAHDATTREAIVQHLGTYYGKAVAS